MSGAGKQDTADAHRRSRVGECVIPSTYFAAFDFGRMIPLTALAVAAGGRSDPNVFNNLVMRCHDTGTVSNTFAAGNVVVVGCKTENDALISAYLHAKLISDVLQIHCTPLNITICNMVCRTEMIHSVPPPAYPGEPMPAIGGNRMHMLETELQKLPNHHSSKFEPLNFPCLWWRAKVYPELGENSRKVTFAFFERGRGVVTGGMPGEVEIYNQIMKSIPSCERGNEFREPTEDEIAKDAADAFQKEALKKGSRASAAAARVSKQPKQQTSAPTPKPAAPKRRIQHIPLSEMPSAKRVK